MLPRNGVEVEVKFWGYLGPLYVLFQFTNKVYLGLEVEGTLSLSSVGNWMLASGDVDPFKINSRQLLIIIENAVDSLLTPHPHAINPS